VRSAAAMAQGHGFANQWGDATGPTAWMPPALPYLLAGLMWLTGSRDVAVVTVNVFQYVTLFGTGLLVLAAAGRTTTARSWLLAPLVVASVFSIAVASDFLYWFQRNWDHWTILFALDLLVLGVGWFEPLASKKGAALWGGVGGLAALINPITGFTWVLLSLTLAVKQRAWLGLALAALSAAVVMSPWVVRNYLVFGRFIPVKSNVAYELYQAQCLQKDAALSSTTFDRHHPYSGRRPEGADYRRLGEVAYMDKVSERFWTSVRADPFEFMDRAANRFLFATLWYAPNYPAPHSFAAQPWAVWWGHILQPLPFIAVLVLLFTGPWEPLSRVQWTVLGCYVFYLTPYVIISYYERYGVPLLGIKVLLVLWAADRVARGARRALSFSRAPTVA
jgi:hypothetical protein